MQDVRWLNSMLRKGGLNVGQKNTKAEEEVRLEKVGGVWHGVAINQNQTVSGGAHRDTNDSIEGFNCFVPYGNWQGGDLLLWELRKRVELREGEALFFRGSIILHNCWNISGSRNSVNLFTHESVLKMDAKRKAHDHRDIDSKRSKT